MLQRMVKTSIAIWMLLSGLDLAAAPIQLRISDGMSVLQEDTVRVPVYADSVITLDDQILAYRLQIDYYADGLQFLDVVTDSTISSLFGAPIVNDATPGMLTIAGAGVNYLEGDSTFLYLQFEVLPDHSGWYNIRFNGGTAANYFNEGQPEMILVNGNIFVEQLPWLNISPDDGILGIGDQQQFWVNHFNSPGPYEFWTEDTAVAEIDSLGMLTATGPGTTRVFVSDTLGNQSVSSGVFEVKPLTLQVESATVWQGETVDLGLQVANPTGLEILSGSFDLTFSDPIVDDISAVTDDSTLMQNAADIVLAELAGNRIRVAFACPEGASSSGDLFRFRIVTSALVSGNCYFDMSQANVNELDQCILKRGTLYTQNLPDLYISVPSSEGLVGDTLRFGITGGFPPYEWSVSDTHLADIDSTGLLTALASGIVRVTVQDSVGAISTTGDIHIWDAYLTAPDTSMAVNSIVDYPIRWESLQSNQAVTSFEVHLNLRQPELQFLSVITDNTLTEGWTVYANEVEDELIIAGASGPGFSDLAGDLFKLHLELTPDLTINEWAHVNITSTLFNEGVPVVDTDNGHVIGALNLTEIVATVPDTVMWEDTVLTLPLTVDLFGHGDIAIDAWCDVDEVDLQLLSNPWQIIATPDPDWFGTTQITIETTQGVRSVVQSSVLDVLAVNDPLWLVNPIQDLVLEDTVGMLPSHIALDSVFQDIEDSPEEFTFSIIGNSHPEIVAVTNSPVELALDVSVSGLLGESRIILEAMDLDSATVVDTFNIEVILHNMAPVITLADSLDMWEDDVAVLPIEITDPNLDSVFTSVMYDSLVFEHVGLVLTDTTDWLEIQPVTDWFGESTIVVSASDAALTTMDTLQVMVGAVNDPLWLINPIQDLVLEDTVGMLPSHISLDSVFQDIEDSPEAFTFSIIENSHPEIVAVTNSPVELALDVSVSGLLGQSRIILEAMDLDSATVVDTFNIEVILHNMAPVITLADSLDMWEDDVVVLPIEITDPNLDSVVTVVMIDSSAFEQVALIMTDTTDWIEIRPVADWYGASQIVISATDGALTTMDTLHVLVGAVNDPPTTFSLISPVDDFENHELLLLPFAWESSTDVEEDSLNYGLHFFNESELNVWIESSSGLSDTLDVVQLGLNGIGWFSWEVFCHDGLDTTYSTEQFTLWIDETVSINAKDVIPESYSLAQNYPNPFNPSTTIRYGLPEPAQVTLIIYNVIGQEVRHYAAGRQQAGYYDWIWDGRDLSGSLVPAGLYLYRINTDNFSKVRKMMILK